MRWNTLLRKSREEHEEMYVKNLSEADRKILADPQILSMFLKKILKHFAKVVKEHNMKEKFMQCLGVLT